MIDEFCPTFVQVNFDEDGQPISVCQCDPDYEGAFPLLYPGLNLEGTIEDEFHRFCLMFENNSCFAVCYSIEVAEHLSDLYMFLEGRDIYFAAIPYENPTLLGEDDFSGRLRVRDYMEEFKQAHGIPQDEIPPDDMHEEFMEYAMEREEEAKSLAFKGNTA